MRIGFKRSMYIADSWQKNGRRFDRTRTCLLRNSPSILTPVLRLTSVCALTDETLDEICGSPECGDGICNAEEDNSSCPADCPLTCIVINDKDLSAATDEILVGDIAMNRGEVVTCLTFGENGDADLYLQVSIFRAPIRHRFCLRASDSLFFSFSPLAY